MQVFVNDSFICFFLFFILGSVLVVELWFLFKVLERVAFGHETGRDFDKKLDQIETCFDSSQLCELASTGWNEFLWIPYLEAVCYYVISRL